MKYLIDTNGNYYEAEKNTTNATEVPKRPSAYHSWQGGAWVLDQAAFMADAQTTTRAELIANRDAAITGGFAYLNKTIDSDRDSVMAITGAGVAALAAKASGLPYSVTWTCADDSTITLDADGVLGMVVTLAMFADAQHAKARPLKDAIKEAKTADDLKKVKW